MNLSGKLLTTLALMVGISMAHAGAVVVAGASSPLTAADSGDMVKVFLGKKKALGGVNVVPVDQAEGTGARTYFYSNVIKKSEAQLKSYWSRLIFTGKGQAPHVVGGNADVKGMVSANPNLLGYIDESAVDASVKVLFKP